MTNQTARNVAWTVTQNGLSFFIDSQSFTINKDHPSFIKVAEALRNKDYDAIPDLMDVAKQMATFLNTKNPDFVMQDGMVQYKGKPFTEEVSEKVLRMLSEGAPAESLENFLIKTRENPSNTAQRELLMFCQANGFMIHEDGDIIAYKKVRSDYKDSYSGTNDNSVGTVVEMDRSDVDDRRDVTCSHGLHFAAHAYAAGFSGSRLMVIKLNPKDVVSIPADYDNEKGRCCRYEVIAEVSDPTQQLPQREVYSDRSIIAGVETPTLRVRRILAALSTRDVSVQDFDLNLNDFGLTDEEVDELVSRLESEFDVTLNVWDFDSDTTGRDVVRLVGNAIEERDSDNEDDNEDDYDSYDVDLDDDSDDEDAVKLDSDDIEAINQAIIRRRIYDSITFRNFIESRGFDLDEVRDSIRANDLGQWL